MRGSAVPTMVWSRAARNSASPTPTVASVRAVRVMSPGTCRLLAERFDRVLEIGKGRAQTRALPLEGQRTALVGGLRHELAEAGKHGQEKAGKLGVTAGVRTLREPAGHRR